MFNVQVYVLCCSSEVVEELCIIVFHWLSMLVVFVRRHLIGCIVDTCNITLRLWFGDYSINIILFLHMYYCHIFVTRILVFFCC